MEDAAIVRSDIAFTLTSPLLDHVKVENADTCPGTGIHPSLLQFASYVSNARPPHSNHLGKKFLRDRDINLNQFVHPN
jgi:hypothetical protein